MVATIGFYWSFWIPHVIGRFGGGVGGRKLGFSWWPLPFASLLKVSNLGLVII
jgi:hypothetical protein